MSEREEGQTVDLEMLFRDEVVNSEAVDKAIRESGSPAGTYTTNPEEYPLNVFVEEREEKDADGKVTGKRRQITLTGLVFATIAGRDEKARVRIRISPDVRQAKEYDADTWTGGYLNKPDSQTKLFAMAAKVYEATVKDKPKSVVALVEFLKENPFRVRTMVGRDGEPVVLAISPTRGR